MILNFTGALTVGATIAILIVAIGSTVVTRLEHRLTFAGIAGAWVALVATVAAEGGLAFTPVLPSLFLLPFLTVGILSAASPAFRSALLRIPVPLIIALNTPRILGVQFLFLAAAGRLAGPFPFSAAIGDMITAVLALQVARIAASKGPNASQVLIWNAFGGLDLIVAVALGVTSVPGSPLQLIHWGVGSAAMTTLPSSLVPTFLVPFYLIGHSIVFIQARRAAMSEQRGIGRPQRGVAASAV